MDPLTITATVVKVSAACLATAKVLFEIRTTYKDAPMCIVSMCSETIVVTASLSKLQSIFLGTTDLAVLLQSRPDLIFALDAALTGCIVLFSCLDEELRHIMAKSFQEGGISWKSKAKMAWNRERLREFVGRLAGPVGLRQSALTTVSNGGVSGSPPAVIVELIC